MTADRFLSAFSERASGFGVKASVVLDVSEYPKPYAMGTFAVSLKETHPSIGVLTLYPDRAARGCPSRGASRAARLRSIPCLRLLQSNLKRILAPPSIVPDADSLWRVMLLGSSDCVAASFESSAGRQAI